MENETIRHFTKEEMAQIKDLKEFMSKASDVKSWNNLREEAKSKYPERIITAVDGQRKWIIEHDKPTKTKTCVGVKL